MRSRVVTEVQGGLGNQLFQVAAGLALSRRLGCALELDLRGLSGSTRRFELSDVRWGAEIGLAAGPLPRREAGVVAAALRRSGAFVGHRLRILSESVVSPDDLLELPRGRYYLRGFWQHLSIAADAGPLLRAALAVDALDGGTPSSIGVHIRRGDYVSNPRAAAVHGAQQREYYLRGVRALRERLGDLPVNVFSDDPDWAAHAMAELSAVNVVPCGAPLVDLLLLAGNDAFVISNSTFGWWGAFLADATDVVAPKRWWSDPLRKDPDIFPRSWDRL